MENIATKWAPVLDPQDPGALSLIHAIHDGLPDLSLARNGPSLAQGAAGFALYFGYRIASRLGDCAANEACMMTHLEAAIGRLDRADSSLFSGYAGVAWAVDHLQSLGLIDAAEDLNEQVDKHILAQLQGGFPFGLTELIQGLVGLGVYALGRKGRGQGEAILEGVIQAMERHAQMDAQGITWLTPPEALPPWQRVAAPHGCHNLGLAHGIGGPIAFLGQAAAGHPQAERLLQGAVDWLLAREIHTEAGSLFHPWEPVGRPRLGLPPARVSWCYGLFGLSLALYGAGVRVGRSQWRERGLGWARECAAAPVVSPLTWDSCLCHGALGNAHLFNRFFQATGDPAFLAACRQWIGRAGELRRPTPVAGGFLTLMEEDHPVPGYDPWLALPGLLEGATGAALALMATLRPVVPAWDAFLLADLPWAP